MTESTAAQEILIDGFNRVRENVEAVCKGLSQADATYRPDAEANSIAWLVWHLTRVQDDHVSAVADVEQAWMCNGWQQEFGLPFDAAATGYGQDGEDVNKVQVAPELLDRYQADVHQRTVDFLRDVSDDDLATVVDKRWDPPVTLSVRLVSVIDDCAQHVGQAAYLRGLVDRRQ